MDGSSIVLLGTPDKVKKEKKGEIMLSHLPL
jgi:hypothetical protein